MRIKISWCSSIWRFDGAKIIYSRQRRSVCLLSLWKIDLVFSGEFDCPSDTLLCSSRWNVVHLCLANLIDAAEFVVDNGDRHSHESKTNISHRESQIVNVLGRRRFTLECELWCWHCSFGRCSSEFKWTSTIEILATDEKPIGNDRVEVERLFLRCRK